MGINPAWYAGLLGFVCPFIVRMVIKMQASRRVKNLIALGISIVLGFFSAYLSGQLNPDAILKSIAATFTVAQIVYDQFFKDLFKKWDMKGGKRSAKAKVDERRRLA